MILKNGPKKYAGKGPEETGDEEIAEEMDGKVTVGKINVDENQDLAMEYQVMSIPTLVILKNGKVVKTFVGVTDKEEIKELLK